MTRVVKALNIAFSLAFVLAAVVQYNDPDPIRWMAVYLGAASSAVAFHLGRLDWRVSAALGVLAVIWASTLVPTVIAHPPPMGDVFGDVKMYAPGVEEAREMGGLLLVTIWMGVIAALTWRRRSE